MSVAAAVLQQLLAIFALAALMALWLAVQRAWRRSFAGELPEPSEQDALAQRGGCGDCGCAAGECRERAGEWRKDGSVSEEST